MKHLKFTTDRKTDITSLLTSLVGFLQVIFGVTFGYFVGASAAFATIPLDNIRTKLQTQTFYQDSRKEQPPIMEKKSPNMKLHSVTARPFISNLKDDVEKSQKKIIKYRSFLSTCRIIFQEEGVRGFYKGVVPRIMSQAPSSAISWSAYEMLKRLLNTNKQL
jgi:Mitochondrial carrier protein.